MSFREPRPLENLALAIGTDAFDLQQKQGQRELTQSAKLPIEGSETDEAKASPIQWGEKGKLFREAVLPPGWKKRATGSGYWTDLVDHKGCGRASIFFRDVFFDQEAFIRFSVRYYAKPEYHQNSDAVTFCVYDCGQGEKTVTIYADTPVLPDREKARDAYYKATDEGEKKAQAWLKERFPNHKDPNAYWDPPA